MVPDPYPQLTGFFPEPRRPEFKFEVQRFAFLNDFLRECITFLRCPEAEPLPRPLVQLGRDRVAVGLLDVRHARPLRQVLPCQPVGVLVDPAFP